MNKIKTLIPLSEFVSKIDEICPRETDQMYDLWKLHQLGLIIKYKNFLLQPLNISMFVPADECGNVLEEPVQYIGALELAIGKDYEDAYNYQQAKIRVLFHGFEWNNILRQVKCIKPYCVVDKVIIEMHRPNVEALLNYNPVLTEQALKQIYG